MRNLPGSTIFPMLPVENDAELLPLLKRFE